MCTYPVITQFKKLWKTTNVLVLGAWPWHLIWRNYVTIYCRAIKNRKANTSNNSSEHENEDRRCAIVLFGIVMIFLVSNIPRIVLNAYEFFVLSSECIIVPFWVYVMTSINGLCLTFNSSFNFFVYCFVNPG